MTNSLLWALVAVLALNTNRCWSFSNCTPKPIANDLPPATIEINLNITTNVTGMDFNVDLQSQNVSDTYIDEMQHPIRRQDILRERMKQQRLASIQSTILQKLGILHTPNMTSSPHKADASRWHMDRLLHLLPRLLRSQKQQPEPDDIYAERVQSFYPSCSLPNNTDRYMWEDGGMFHIFYDIPMPRLSQGTSLTVSSAKLRLFKSAIPAVEPLPTVITYASNQQKTHSVASVLDCDERFRVSVYQYTRPLKKNKRVKKGRKLIDSQMVAADYTGWVEFDVRLSTKDWLDNDSKNMGLEIVLEDSLANTHNPADFFINMNCSEDHIHLVDNESLLFENETYPTLDLRTVERLETEGVPVKNEVQKRKRRDVSNWLCNTRSDANNSCRMATVYVSFTELGWDDILVPDGFYTGICFDRCPISRSKGSCVPQEKSELRILYVNNIDSSIQYGVIPNIVVKSCTYNLK